MAEGVTVNLRQTGNQYNLRIWVMGAAVEDSQHQDLGSAMGRLADVVVSKMGGERQVLAALLGHLGGFT